MHPAAVNPLIFHVPSRKDLNMPQLLWNGPQSFFSYKDEEALFTWLKSIKGVTRVEGIPDNLIIHIRSKRLSDEALRDLIGVYTRYHGDLSQLKVFLTPKNKKWFKDPKKYWYAAVFKAPKNSRVLTITLREDEALVLSAILESKKFARTLKIPERNAPKALVDLLERQLAPAFCPDYKRLMKAARAVLADRYKA